VDHVNSGPTDQYTLHIQRISLHILSRANATDQESGFQPAVRKSMLAATKPGGTP
jgi:hypothetical protein